MDRRASEIAAVISPRASCLLAVLGLAITVFIPFAAVSQTTLNAGDPVTNAVRDGDVQAVRNLVVRNAKLNVADVDGRTPLMLATISGHLGIVEVLLEAGARSELRDSLGNTGLHWAAVDGDLEIASLFVAAVVPVNGQNRQGLTAMMLAAKGGHIGVVELLLENGGDARLTDYTGRDAIGWARDARRPTLISPS